MNRLIGGFRSDGARPANVAPKAWASVTNPQDISMTAGSRSRHGAPSGPSWTAMGWRATPESTAASIRSLASYGCLAPAAAARGPADVAAQIRQRRTPRLSARVGGGQLCGPPSHAASGNARRPGRSWATAAACSGPGARTQAHSRRPVAGFSDQWAERRGGAVPSRGGMAGADAAHARWTMDMRVSWDGPRVRPGPGFTLPGRVRAT